MKKVYPAKQFARVTLVVMMMIFSLSGLQAQTNRVDETRMVTFEHAKGLCPGNPGRNPEANRSNLFLRIIFVEWTSENNVPCG